jgi:hypothetical protein|tara:strand:+ start:3909 stop:4100 length:192 start_codon:yes stop_codon:yes gene_type:complete
MTLIKEPKPINQESIEDGVELALKFFTALENSEQAHEKRKNMRYLGMTIRSLKHNLNIGSNST